MTAFLLKKWISAFLYPIPVLCLLFALGLVLLLFFRGRGRSLGKGFLGFGLVVFFLSAFDPLPVALTRSLEKTYPPLLGPEAVTEHYGLDPHAIRHVLVLGGGAYQSPSLPPGSNLPPAALARLTEGLRWTRQLPNTTLILSGGGRPGRISSAEAMQSTALAFGLPADRILLQPEALDTRAEARTAAVEIGDEPFILVTSATHLPRAMRLFENEGLRPIPAPTDFLVDPEGPRLSLQLHPANFERLQRSLHERMGLLWFRLTR